MKDPTALIFPVAFACGAVLSGWIGIGRWTGAWWSVAAVLSGIAIGAYFQKPEKKP